MKINLDQKMKSSQSQLTPTNSLEQTGCAGSGVLWARASWTLLCLAGMLLLSTVVARAQGTTTFTSNPVDGANGVSVLASVVFTFSAAMGTSTTGAFLSITSLCNYPV